MVQYMEIHQRNPLYKKTKRKNMIISLDAEKEFDKIQHSFIEKSWKDQGTQGPHLNTVKGIYSKQVANIKLKGKKL